MMDTEQKYGLSHWTLHNYYKKCATKPTPRIESFPEAYKLVRLPGQPHVSFQQFSGYITVDEKQHRSLFYYFVEAETNPASKPLVLWLNGGPGCSSVGAGAFVEHGPFRPTKGNNLVRNEYSWNKEANMLYLESPAGVGFSYSANQTFYSNVNDAMTGHYVPQLARLIIRSKVNFNLKGIAIGNPLLEFNTDFNAQDHYYWSHGLISDSTYQLLTSVCNNSKLMREAMTGTVSTACFGVYIKVEKELSGSVDLYDVTADVCLSSNQSQFKIFNQQLSRSRLHEYLSPQVYPQVLQPDSFKDQKRTKQVMGKVDVCLQEETTKYLNRKDVQMALHARLVGVTNWHICSAVLEYDKTNEEIPTIHVVQSLVKSGLTVLVYSGDQDSVIPFTGTRSLVNKLAKDLRLKPTVPYRAWFSGKQVGGWTQVYGPNLTFATIRGASHTAPTTQPKRSLLLFKAFLEKKPLPIV
ncbi:unnamed protein product [Dovyalis caffra]|uniref:Serine carboxypeptidase-like 45 n=1 Tax=Dovyalis caffra TaxID=77055 RepID=A0AAV1RU84_9ROSI|nr:unnamed protein product [Dovyalis caffra]